MSRASRALLWVIGSIAAFGLALFATLPIITVSADLFAPPLGFDRHLLSMALWPIVWALLAAGGIWLLRNVLLGPVRPQPMAVVLLLLGCVIAAWHHVALQRWLFHRFGYVDPDMVGWTVGLFAVLAMIGVAAFATLIAPARVAWVPAGVAVIGAAGTVLIGVDNAISGVPNGIASDSVPLAVTLVVASLYAIGASVMVVRQLWRTSRPDDAR